MRTVWQQDGAERRVTAPVSLIVTGFAPVGDARRALTPELRRDAGPTRLWLSDLGQRQNRLGGSALAQVYGRIGTVPPDLDEPRLLARFFAAVQELNAAGLLLAYHDRADGGLLATVAEMAFAGGCGATVALDALGNYPVAALFAEELGAVLQVESARRGQLDAILQRHGLSAQRLGTPSADDVIRIGCGDQPLLAEPRVALQRLWSETSWRMQSLRDNPESARQEYDRILDTCVPR